MEFTYRVSYAVFANFIFNGWLGKKVILVFSVYL